MNLLIILFLYGCTAHTSHRVEEAAVAVAAGAVAVAGAADATADAEATDANHRITANDSIAMLRQTIQLVRSNLTQTRTPHVHKSRGIHNKQSINIYV